MDGRNDEGGHGANLRRAYPPDDSSPAMMILQLQFRHAEDRIAEQRRELDGLRTDLESMKRSQLRKEQRWLWTGVTVLGGITLTLIGVIWTLIEQRIFGP
jgi:hypothetical protein